MCLQRAKDRALLAPHVGVVREHGLTLAREMRLPAAHLMLPLRWDVDPRPRAAAGLPRVLPMCVRAASTDLSPMRGIAGCAALLHKHEINARSWRRVAAAAAKGGRQVGATQRQPTAQHHVPSHLCLLHRSRRRAGKLPQQCWRQPCRLRLLQRWQPTVAELGTLR
jgi:hypothetical protein